MARVVDPFLKSLRGKVRLIAYSLPGGEDPVRKKLYRSIHRQPTSEDRLQARKELTAKLQRFPYQGAQLDQRMMLSSVRPAVDYFRQFPGLDASAVQWRRFLEPADPGRQAARSRQRRHCHL